LLLQASRLFLYILTGHPAIINASFGKQQQSCFELQVFQKPKIQLNQDLKRHQVGVKRNRYNGKEDFSSIYLPFFVCGSCQDFVPWFFFVNCQSWKLLILSLNQT